MFARKILTSGTRRLKFGFCEYQLAITWNAESTDANQVHVCMNSKDKEVDGIYIVKLISVRFAENLSRLDVIYLHFWWTN